MRKSLQRTGVLFCAVLMAPGFAAIAQEHPAFEVASVKPAVPGAPAMSIQRQAGGRMTMTNVTPRWLIRMAWALGDYQIVGAPAWFDSEHFDIVARPEKEIPQTQEGRNLLNAMFRSLVEERFGFAHHVETRQLPVYLLVVAKNGAKLTVTSDPDKDSKSAGRGMLAGRAIRIPDFAKELSQTLGQSVIDQTGLTGQYDFKLLWEPDSVVINVAAGDSEAPKPSDRPGLFTAIQEQMGLKLEPRKGPVEVLVVDSAERPSAN